MDRTRRACRPGVLTYVVKIVVYGKRKIKTHKTQHPPWRIIPVDRTIGTMANADRNELLTQLTASVEGKDRPSTFVLVTGERGSGKTFLGQELYRRLALGQEPPPFWPADMLGPERGGLEQNRHVTRPSLASIPPDAKPTYGWIGINCQRAVDGMYFDALSAAAVQVTRLRSAVEAALHSGHAGRSRAVLLSLLEVAAAFGSLAQDPAATALGLALTARPAANAYHAAVESRAEHRDVRGRKGEGLTIDLHTPDRQTISTYCELLKALTDRIGLPTVLFVDDLQHADPTLLSLLALLPDAVPRNLTVLCTADQNILDAQSDAAQEGDRRAGAWLARADLTAWTRPEITPLDNGTLTRIVLAHAPRTERATVAALVHQCGGNPYRLRLLLDSPRAQPRKGAVVLEPREIADLPSRFGSLYQQAWSLLSAEARQVVAIAAMQGYVAAEDVLRGACHFLGIPQVEQCIAEARSEQWLLPSAGVLAFRMRPATQSLEQRPTPATLSQMKSEAARARTRSH